MLDAISATQVAMVHDQLRLESINQNVSNMQTPGYKRQVLEATGFEDQFSVQMQSVNRTMQRSTQNIQGTLVQTKIPSELALAGEGYFEVQTPKGVFYTRRGDFHINQQGELVTAQGAPLLGTGGPIRVEDNQFTIDKQGCVFVNNQKADQIKIVQFANPQHLNYLGEGLFESQEVATPAHGTPLLQGHLEQSNVKSIEEMMEMVKISRHFEASQRVMRLADGLLSTAINQLGESNV
jgi:flagellar basal body rod protein FlgG